MTFVGQSLWLCLFLFCLMTEDFAFVLMYHGETSQLTCGADHLSRFYLVNGIERNIVIFTGLLCLYLIGCFLSVLFFILNLLFYFCSGVCSIILFQRCRLILILSNIEGQSEFSTIANSSIDGNIEKCLNQHFFRCIY